MKVALIEGNSNHIVLHRVRGSGVYAQTLLKSLKKYFPRNSYELLSYNNKIKADIIHFLYFEPFFRTLPFFKRHKTVVTVHDLTPLVFPKEFSPGIKGKLKWKLQKSALSRVDLIITDSNSSKRDIAKFTGIKERKIKVVYLAPGEEFKKINISKKSLENLKSKYDLPDEFAFYVGDSTWNKNLPNLIKAAIAVKTPLVLAGKALMETDFDKKNPWNRDLLEAQNLAKDNSNIKLLGFVASNDLVSIYNIASVFIMPSFYEGFGLPILEAMACGCPVITSKEGSLSEISSKSAFYVDPYDINDIAKGLKKVFTDKTLQKELSNRGFKNIKRFSWKKTAEETLKAYQSIL